MAMPPSLSRSVYAPRQQEQAQERGQGQNPPAVDEQCKPELDSNSEPLKGEMLSVPTMAVVYSRSEPTLNVGVDRVKLEPFSFSASMDDVKPKVEEEGDVKLGLENVKPKLEDVKPKLEDVKPKVEDVKAESGSSTPVPPPTPVRTGPQLIGHLPVATDEAKKTFEEIPDNHYQYQTLGRSREEFESMTCDCVYEHGEDAPYVACGDGSDCINRLTQVECISGDCRCRGYCQNQRFQRKQYAPIEVVQTEMKGFGLRAADDIAKDAFIYEYVGDVVSNPSFVKRMRQYAEQGIRHFYFMMLQRDEFIDATKRGGIGRFANHSCNPNCYVAKWTVGERVRMGIFAKRKIQMHEELTFNYNVDRYGHEAQPCYCSEPNCVGFIGGKTQTDVGAMDDLYLDALGLTDEVERLGLKGTKKKKGKKLDEDYMPEMKPLEDKGVPKWIQALRSVPKRYILSKMLSRMQVTEEQSVFRQIMRLRGFSIMTNIMHDYKDDADMLLLVVNGMSRWPLLARNKIDDSKICEPVQRCTESDNETLKSAAQKLLDAWALLETAYRIPKRLKDGDDSSRTPDFLTPADLFGSSTDVRPSKKSRTDLEDDIPVLDIKPLGITAQPRESRETTSAPVPVPDEPKEPTVKRPSKAQTASVIAAALAAQQAEAAAAQARAEEEKKKKAAKAEREKKRRERKEREKTGQKRDKAASKEANREKRLLKLVGAVVVKVMSKYKAKLPAEAFKKHAKELTHLVAEKEKKSSSYKENKLESLSDEKTAKIKKFAKEYIHKVIHRLEKGKRASGSGSASGSGIADSPSTPLSAGLPTAGADDDDATGDVGMTIEEAMDLSDEESEGDDDDDQEKGEDADGQGQDEDMPDADSLPKGAEESTPTEPVEPATPADPRLPAVWDKGGREPDSLSQGEPMVIS